jgi:hypothetical protein
MNNTFRNSEDKRFDEMFPNIDGIGGSHGIWIKSVFAPYSLEVKSFLHESQRRLVEEIVKNIEERIHNLKHVYPVTDFAGDGERRDGEITGLEKTISIINQTLK